MQLTHSEKFYHHIEEPQRYVKGLKGSYALLMEVETCNQERVKRDVEKNFDGIQIAEFKSK